MGGEAGRSWEQFKGGETKICIYRLKKNLFSMEKMRRNKNSELGGCTHDPSTGKAETGGP